MLVLFDAHGHPLRDADDRDDDDAFKAAGTGHAPTTSAHTWLPAYVVSLITSDYL